MEDKKEVDKVILTGAELSKYFGDVYKRQYLDSMNIKITLLSNAEKLDDINFVREISNRINSCLLYTSRCV